MCHNNRLSEHVWMGQTLNFHHLSPMRDHELDMWWLHLMLHPSWDTRTASVRPGGALHTPVLQIGHSEFQMSTCPQCHQKQNCSLRAASNFNFTLTKSLTQLIPSLPWFSLRIFSKVAPGSPVIPKPTWGWAAPGRSGNGACLDSCDFHLRKLRFA